MAESNDTKDTTVKNENGKLTTPKTDGETSTNTRELSDFEQAAAEGSETAKANLATESKENGKAKPGAENVTEKVTTSETQTELRDKSDPATVKSEAKSPVAGAEKTPQDAVKVGLEAAKKNHKAEVAANKAANS